MRYIDMTNRNCRTYVRTNERTYVFLEMLLDVELDIVFLKKILRVSLQNHENHDHNKIPFQTWVIF